jgi:hypothetical protein
MGIGDVASFLAFWRARPSDASESVHHWRIRLRKRLAMNTMIVCSALAEVLCTRILELDALAGRGEFVRHGRYCVELAY